MNKKKNDGKRLLKSRQLNDHVNISICSSHTLTRGCPETSPGDGALAISIARDTANNYGLRMSKQSQGHIKSSNVREREEEEEDHVKRSAQCE